MGIQSAEEGGRAFEEWAYGERYRTIQLRIIIPEHHAADKGGFEGARQNEEVESRMKHGWNTDLRKEIDPQIDVDGRE
jgi:hypothetical protein